MEFIAENRFRMKTQCFNQRSEMVLEGKRSLPYQVGTGEIGEQPEDQGGRQMRKGLGIVMLVLLWATTAVAADVIKLGGMYPLSGRAADLGITCKQGAELAVKEVNAKGGVLGKKLELLSTDSKANVQEAVAISNRYIQRTR